MINDLSRNNHVFFIKNQSRQSICMIYIQMMKSRQNDFICFEVLLRDVQRYASHRIKIYDIKRCLLIINMLQLNLEKKTQFEEQKQDIEDINTGIVNRYVIQQNNINKLKNDIFNIEKKKQQQQKKKENNQNIDDINSGVVHKYVNYSDNINKRDSYLNVEKKTQLKKREHNQNIDDIKTLMVHRYVNYSDNINQLRDSILKKMITDKKKIFGQSIDMGTMVIKNEQIGLRIKDDESILRHLIVRSPRLLNYFNLVHRSYVLKSKELGGRCVVTANFYTIKNSEYNPNQSMLVYLNIFPYNLRIKQFNIFLGYQDLQAVDKQTCLYIFEKHNFMTENVMQCLAQKIVSQVFVFRTFLGMQLYFKQIRAPKPVRRKTLLLNSPYKKLSVSNKKYLLQTTASIEYSAIESQKSGDSFSLGKGQSRHENDESFIGSQKAISNANLLVPLSTINSPHSGNLDNYTQSQFQHYHHQMSQQYHNHHSNRMKDKHMKGIKNMQSSNPVKDMYQKKKAAETLTKIKYVRNKYTKFNFDQGIDKELSKPFLEEVVHQKRIVYQSAKVFNNQYAVVTVMRDLVFDSFCLQIYIPKMSRTIQSKITLSKLVDCSWNFFSQVFKDKFFFFFDNSSYLQIFESYQRFALRCLYMEKEKSNPKNNHKKISPENSMFTLAEPLSEQFLRIKVTDENQAIQTCNIYSLRTMKDISMSDSDEYQKYVNPNAQQVKFTNQEPIFNNFMKEILPKSEIYTPNITNPSFKLGVNAFMAKEKILKFTNRGKKRGENDAIQDQIDEDKQTMPNIQILKKSVSETKKQPRKSIYSSSKNENRFPEIKVNKINDQSKDSDFQQRQDKESLMKEYLNIPLLNQFESSDMDNFSKISASPRQLSFQLKKKSEEIIRAQMEKRKSMVIQKENGQEHVNYNQSSYQQKVQTKIPNDTKKDSEAKKIEVKGLWRSIVLKHRIKLIYGQNQKRLFEFFRKENSRKIDRIYQFVAITEHIDTFYINQIQSSRQKQLYNYIEIYIWDKLIQQFTTIQACPDRDNMKQEDVEPYMEREEVPNNKNDENSNDKNINNNENNDDISEKNAKNKGNYYNYSVYLCIDNNTKLFLRELLHTDYMKIDRNEEYQTSVFVDFIKKTQDDTSHDRPKHLIHEDQPILFSKKEKAEAYYFETLPTIGYTETSNHIVYIKHQNLNDQTVQKMRINLREIVNLFIAEGYFKSQTNYANSKLSYAEMKQLCHFIIYKIKTNEFFDIVEIKTTIRNIYYQTQILDPVQKIMLKSVLDINRKTIKFIVTKNGTYKNTSTILSTQFFEEYVPFFQSLMRSKQYDLALRRVSSVYRPQILFDFYEKNEFNQINETNEINEI